MKNLVFALTMTASLVAGPASAQRSVALSGPSQTPTAKALVASARAAPVLPAKEIKIDPSLASKMGIILGLPTTEEAAALRKKADYVLGNQWVSLWYVCFRKVELMKQCAEKAFSANDQQAAGCLPTETVQACSEKLLKWCVYDAPTIVYGGHRWPACQERRAPLVKELEGLEQEIRLFRLKVTEYATF